MKTLPASLVPLHLTEGPLPGCSGEAADEPHPLAEKLRLALANPNATDIAAFAEVVEVLHAELKMLQSPLIDAVVPAGEKWPLSAEHQEDLARFFATQQPDDDRGPPLPV